MVVDSNNPIVGLCVSGVQAELEGRGDDAMTLFERAWSERSNDHEACVAAYHLARSQKAAVNALHWSQVALDHASAVEDDSVRLLYPSLYLQLGLAFEDLDDLVQADASFFLARERARHLPDDERGGQIRREIEEGLHRVARKIADVYVQTALAG